MYGLAWSRVLPFTSTRRNVQFLLFVGLCLTLFLVPLIVFGEEESKVELSPGQHIMLWMSEQLMTLANWIGKLIANLINVVLVPVLSYNGFGTSKIVGSGWAVVRDVMNMFFIALLLILAMVTIFGGEVGSWSVKWQKQLPQILLFAILINFSRTITTLLIDIGQVIMLTFANAIRDIAGGNIIQLFGLADILSLDAGEIAKKVEQGGGIEIPDLFGGALLAVMMMMIVLGTIIMLLMILIMRIVYLWILMILSPLAFFFGGAKGLLGNSVQPYSDWWQKLTSSIAIGPVLVFFLWLALSVAGSGNIAATENFHAGAGGGAFESNPGGLINRIADSGRMLSFVLGIGIIFAGFEASSKFANALPGASKVLQGGAMRALKLGALYTAGAGVLAKTGTIAAGVGLAKGTGMAGREALLSQKGQAVMGAAARQTTRLGRGLQATGTLGAVFGLRAAGRQIAGLGAKLESTRRGANAQRVRDQEKKIQDYDKTQLDGLLDTGALTAEGRAMQQAARLRILSTKALRNEYDKADLEQIVQDFQDAGGEQLLLGDSKMMDQWTGFKKSRVDLLPEEEKKKMLARMTNEEILQLDAAAFKDDAVMDELKSADRKEWDHGKHAQTSLYDRITQSGRGSRAIRESIEAYERDEVIDPEKVSDEALRRLGKERQKEGVMRQLASTGVTGDRPLGRLEVLMENPEFNIEELPVDMLEDASRAVAFSGALSPDQLLRMTPDQMAALQKAVKEAIDKEEFRDASESTTAANRAALQRTYMATAGGSEGLKQMGYENGEFTSPEARTQFEALIESNPILMAELESEIDPTMLSTDLMDYFEQGGPVPGRYTSGSSGALRELPAVYAKATEAERQKLDRFIEKLTRSLTTKLDGMESRGVDTKATEYKDLDKRIKWIDQMHANAVSRASRQELKRGASV